MKWGEDNRSQPGKPLTQLDLETRRLVALPGGFRRKKREVEQVTVVLESGQMREIKGILNAAIGAGLRGSSGPVAAGGFIRLSNIMVAV